MYDYSRKKQRWYKREVKRILQYLQSVEPTYLPQYQNAVYESIKCYANLFFVPKGKVKKDLLHILLQKTEQIIANKPKDLSFCKVFLSVPKNNIAHAQISLLFDENYYHTFWNRNDITIQRWTKLEKPPVTQTLDIPTTLPYCGYLEEIQNEFGFFCDEIWFYGEIRYSWEWESIRKEITNIHQNGILYLTDIEKLPHKSALQIAAYLWEGSCTTTNDFWYTISRGLLWHIPLHWLKQHTKQILQIMNINWQDDFEYDNACVTFAHQPEILQILIDWGKQQNMTEYATQWEQNGCQTTYFSKTITEFERLCAYYQISFGTEK